MRKKFDEAEVKLPAKTRYMNVKNVDREFNKDNNGNTVEDWTIYISKQKDEDFNEAWMTIVRRNKNGENVTQIDFDAISKKQLGKYIQGLHKIYKQMD